MTVSVAPLSQRQVLATRPRFGAACRAHAHAAVPAPARAQRNGRTCDHARVDCQALADVVAQISEGVVRAGFPDRAATLQGWEEDLRSGDLGRQHDARDELRGVVRGMGGLTDMLYGSPEERLVDVLWQEIKV